MCVTMPRPRSAVGCTDHALRLQPRDFRLDVVGHEPELMHVVVFGVCASPDRMVEPEEQAASAHIDMREFEHIAEKRPVGIFVFRIDDVRSSP